MTKQPKYFKHNNAYYYPILKDYFDKQGKNEKEFINKKGELNKFKQWFCSMDDFKLFIDCVEEQWERKKEKHGRKSKRK